MHHINQSCNQSVNHLFCKCLIEPVIIVDWFSSQMFWRYILDGYLGFQSFSLDLDFYSLRILIDSIECFKYRSSWNNCVPTKERRKKNFGWWNNSSWNSGICFLWKRKQSQRSLVLPSIMLYLCRAGHCFICFNFYEYSVDWLKPTYTVMLRTHRYQCAL